MNLKMWGILARLNILMGLFFLWLAAAGLHHKPILSNTADATINVIMIIAGYASLRVLRTEADHA